MSSIYFNIEEKDDYTIVSVNFDIDSNHIEVISTFIDNLKNIKSTNLVFKLSEVKIIDSFGLGKLLKLINSLNKTHERVYLCSLNNQIKYLFEMTKLDTLVKIFDSEKDVENFIKNN